MTTPGKTTCRLCQRCCRIVVSGDGVGDGLVVNAAGADDTVCRDGVDGGSTVAVSVVTLSPVTLLVPLAPVTLLAETVSTVVVSTLTVSTVAVSTVAATNPLQAKLLKIFSAPVSRSCAADVAESDVGGDDFTRSFPNDRNQGRASVPHA